MSGRRIIAQNSSEVPNTAPLDLANTAGSIPAVNASINNPSEITSATAASSLIPGDAATRAPAKKARMTKAKG
jgi:hypothetical protein